MLLNLTGEKGGRYARVHPSQDTLGIQPFGVTTVGGHSLTLGRHSCRCHSRRGTGGRGVYCACQDQGLDSTSTLFPTRMDRNALTTPNPPGTQPTSLPPAPHSGVRGRVCSGGESRYNKLTPAASAAKRHTNGTRWRRAAPLRRESRVEPLPGKRTLSTAYSTSWMSRPCTTT